jgi:hypothetical protein
MAFDTRISSVAGRYFSIQAPVGGHGLSPEARRRSRGRRLGKDVGYAVGAATYRDSGMSCSSIEDSEISCKRPELARRGVVANRETRCDVPVDVVVVPDRASRSRRQRTASGAKKLERRRRGEVARPSRGYRSNAAGPLQNLTRSGPRAECSVMLIQYVSVHVGTEHRLMCRSCTARASPKPSTASSRRRT